VGFRICLARYSLRWRTSPAWAPRLCRALHLGTDLAHFFQRCDISLLMACSSTRAFAVMPRLRVLRWAADSAVVDPFAADAASYFFSFSFSWRGYFFKITARTAQCWQSTYRTTDGSYRDTGRPPRRGDIRRRAIRIAIEHLIARRFFRVRGQPVALDRFDGKARHVLQRRCSTACSATLACRKPTTTCRETPRFSSVSPAAISRTTPASGWSWRRRQR